MKKEVSTNKVLLNNAHQRFKSIWEKEQQYPTRLNQRSHQPAPSPTPYAELSARSCFSFLRGASHPEELIEQAHLYGYKAIGITDLNGFYGMVRAHVKAKELGIKYLTGCEIELQEGFPLRFLAKNKKGYQRLCRLLSEGFASAEKAKPIFNIQQVLEWVDPQDITTLVPPKAVSLSDQLIKKLFGALKATQLITRHYHPDLDHQLKKHVDQLPPKPPLAWTWNAEFHHPSRYELYQVIQAIRENTPLSQLLPQFNGENYLKPLHEIKRLCIPNKWLKGSLEIAEACEFSADEIRYRYPQEWLPKGKTAHELLRELCHKGLETRYKGRPSKKVTQQLEYELKLVQELEYEDYFLTVWDIVHFARSKNILCQGRGSAANSIICYLLEITSIDPVHINLLFERFISKERNEAPDIDIDFEHERREEVIQYIYQKYGRHRAGIVATLITYRTRSSLRDVGKALEVSEEKLEFFSKKSRWRENPFETKTDDPVIQRMFRLARQLKGFPRHLGQHTGGMIICQDRLDEISPIEPARMAGRSLVQWDKYDIEKLGLLKVDILALGMLTCLRKSFDLLKEHQMADLELYQIPADDPTTYEMIQKSRTVGVFQIESRAQMTMLPRLKPKCFYDLVIEVAIIRPGPIQGGMIHPYLRRRRGLEEVSYAHPKLKPILEKTLGIPIFQEQVMKMAIEIAGYSPGEADQLRRAMGAWKKKGNLEYFSNDMRNRLIENGIPESFSEQICQQILGFGEYGFPESHAASFALLTYASCYIKAHYPEVFLCALLNSQPLGFYSQHALISNFKREGVRVLMPSLANSIWDNQLEEIGWGQKAVRLGFRQIRGLQMEHVEAFIQSRTKQDPNLLIFDVDERSALSMSVEENQGARRESYWKSLDSSQSRISHFDQEKRIKTKQLSDFEHLLLDFEFLNTSMKHHPAELIKEQHWNYPFDRQKIWRSQDLPLAQEHQRVAVFGMLEVIQSPPTAKGMYFLTLEDETGFLNLAIQPPTYQKFKDLIQSQWSFLVIGRVQGDSHYRSLLVEEMLTPQRASQVNRVAPSQTRQLPLSRQSETLVRRR